MNETESFDKVFNVPIAPGNHTNGIHVDIEQPPSVEVTKPEEEIISTNNNAEDEPITKDESDNNGCVNPDEEYVPKTPSTAERRKIFEATNKENEAEDTLESLDGNNFERASLQRSSIAERRRMYERSQSVQETGTNVEKPDGSPVMLRRKDSFKNRKSTEITKEETPKKVVPKQQSLDPQAGKKNDIAATPTPKRTSTVFG